MTTTVSDEPVLPCAPHRMWSLRASKIAKKPRRRTMGRPPGRRITSTCAVQAVGIATTAMAGALVMMITAPQATADPSSSLQPVIDQILAEMQQAAAYDSALPFATESSNAVLPTVLQNNEYELLTAIISAVNNQVFFQSPEPVAGDAADPRQYFQFFTPDIYYNVKTNLDPDATYVLTGTLGAGTEHLSISSEEIVNGTTQTHNFLEQGSTLVVNPNGTFTVDIASTEPSGAVNYLNDTDATSLLIRDDLGNWALGPGNISIQCVADCPAAVGGTTGLSTAQLNTLLNALAGVTGSFNQQNMILAEHSGIQLAPNSMSPLQPENFFGAGLPTAQVSIGNFDLQPDEALIVQVPNVPAAYSGIEIENVFGSALPYTLAQTTLNNTQAFHDPDGYTYYVISATNPGVANWLDSGSVDAGEVIARFEGLPAGSNAQGLDVTTQLVPLADVAHYLPADTPTVTPADFAADMSARVLSYDYALDTSRGTDWVIEEVLLHDIQAAMGTANFDAVFGSEPSTPMWLRLTPALSPDLLALAKDILTNPSGSLTAIEDNLALAGNDIWLPIELAAALVEQDFTQTAQAVQGDLSSGQPLQALIALATGVQQLASIPNDALFDPNTSITAGILNARDDLATAIFTANGGFPSQAGPLATLEWEYLPQLAQLTPVAAVLGTVLNDLSTVLNPADFAMLF